MPKKGETQKKMKKKEEEDILETLVFSSENVNKSFVNSLSLTAITRSARIYSFFG